MRPALFLEEPTSPKTSTTPPVPRSDGIKGTGTLNDPYDGGSAERFDVIMKNLPQGKPVRVHLGPCSIDKPLKTAGFWLNSDGTPNFSGWQPRANMEIVGSGIDVTCLKLEPATGAGTDGRHYFAIGAGGNNGTDFLSVSNLTIDCNLPSSSNIACGAIRVMGQHVRVRDVKCINWGNRTSGGTAIPGFVVALLIVDGDQGEKSAPWLTVDDCGIEQCVAVEPSPYTLDDAPVHVFHIGGRQLLNSYALQVGRAPFIRDCFVDGTFTNTGSPDLNKDIRALSMNGCYGGVVERNQIRHVRVGGPYQERIQFRDLIVRNNTLHNVVRGPWCNGFGRGPNILPPGTEAVMYVDSGFGIVTMPEGQGHGLGDFEVIALDDILVVQEFVLDAENFAFETSLPGGVTYFHSICRVFGMGMLLAEGNLIELTPDPIDLTPIGLLVVSEGALYQFRLHGNIIVRNNQFRYPDGLTGSFAGYAIEVNGAGGAAFLSNLIATVPMSGEPMQAIGCAAVTNFDNREPDGDLAQPPAPFVQGNDPFTKQLGIPAEEVLLSGCFNG
jgi:hypothetical protein